MKIGTKLVVFLTVPLVLLVILFGYLGVRGIRQRLHHEFQREGRGIALTARMALEDYLRDRQIDDVREMVEKISGYERILGIRIFGPDGKLLCQSSSLNTYPFTQGGDLLRALKQHKEMEGHRSLGSNPVVSFVFPLSATDGTILGAAQFLQLESYIQEDARASRNSVAALTLTMILAVGLVVLMVTRFSVTRPVEDLVQSFREVGSREPVSRVPVRRAALEQARYLVEVGRTVNLSGCTEYRRAGEERPWTP